MHFDHLCVLFGEMSIYIFCPFFTWVVCFVDIEVRELLVYSGDESLVGHIVCRYFPPVWRLSLHFCFWLPLLYKSF